MLGRVDVIVGIGDNAPAVKAAPGNGHLFVADSAQSDGWKATTGTPSSSTFLRGDASWADPGRTEAKTAVGTDTVTVTWTTAFATTPVCNVNKLYSTVQFKTQGFTSISTTGATAYSHQSNGPDSASGTFQISAREAS